MSAFSLNDSPIISLIYALVIVAFSEWIGRPKHLG